MKASEVSVDGIARSAKGTGSAAAGNVAPANDNTTTEAIRKRIVMFPPGGGDSHTVKETKYGEARSHHAIEPQDGVPKNRRPAPFIRAAYAARPSSAPRCFSRGITSCFNSRSELCQASGL